MQLTVHGVHVDVGHAYQVRVEEALKGLSQKYNIEIISASAQLSKNSIGFTTEVSAHIGRGVSMRASDSAAEAFNSVDLAINKLDARLRKYKKRLADHHKHRDHHVEHLFTPYYIIRSDDEESENHDEHAAPSVIAETQEAMPVLSVKDAVFYFDLSDKPAMLFKNAGTGAINMIYRRNDGNLGWVETK